MRGNILRGWTVNYYILYYILQLIIFGVLYQIIQPIQTYNMEALPIQTLTDPWYGIVLMNYVFSYACLYNEWSAVGVACGWLKQHRQGHGLPTTWWLWGAWILLEWSELIHWLNVMLGLAYNQFKEMHALVHCAFTQLTLLAWPGLGKASIVESAALSLRGKRCVTDVMHLNVCCNCCICSWKCVMHLTVCCICTWILFSVSAAVVSPNQKTADQWTSMHFVKLIIC